MIDKNAKHFAKKDIRSAMARLMNAARASQSALDPPEPINGPLLTPLRVEAEPEPELNAPPARKVPVSIRLDADLVAAMRESGRGWQSRANAMLRDAMGLDPDPNAQVPPPRAKAG